MLPFFVEIENLEYPKQKNYLCSIEKEHVIVGIKAIIEAIQSGKDVDKAFI